MTVTSHIVPTSAACEAGAEAVFTVRIKNAGGVVDRYTVEVLGDLADSAVVEPPVVSLLPGEEGEAFIRVRPPRLSSTASGAQRIGIRVTPGQAPDRATVEEATLEVAPFVEGSVDLVPRVQRGARSGTYDVAVENRGNVGRILRFSAAQPDNLLAFAFTPPTITVRPGGAAFVRLQARTRRRFLRGPERALPFQVGVDSDTGPAAALEGTLLQTQLLPAWFAAAVLGVVGVALAFLILFLGLRHEVQLAARDEVDRSRSTAAPVVVAPPAQGGVVVPPPGSGVGATPGVISVAPTSAAVASGAPQPAPAVATPVDNRLTVTQAPNTSTSGATAPAGSTFTVPANQTLSITDVLFENPQGDSGSIELLRNGNVVASRNLQSFRDSDLHLVTPLTFKSGDQVKLVVSCGAPGNAASGTPASPGPAASACNEALLYTGYVR